MPMRYEFWRHMAVFAATVSHEYDHQLLLRIIRCENVTAKFVYRIRFQYELGTWSFEYTKQHEVH